MQIKIRNISVTSALTVLENKIRNNSSLVKRKPDYNTKNYWNWKKNLTDHDHDQYITIPEFNNLAAVFTAWLAQANLVAKTDFDDKLRSLNQKTNSNKTFTFWK